MQTKPNQTRSKTHKNAHRRLPHPRDRRRVGRGRQRRGVPPRFGRRRAARGAQARRGGARARQPRQHLGGRRQVQILRCDQRRAQLQAPSPPCLCLCALVSTPPGACLQSYARSPLFALSRGFVAAQAHKTVCIIPSARGARALIRLRTLPTTNQQQCGSVLSSTPRSTQKQTNGTMSPSLLTNNSPRPRFYKSPIGPSLAGVHVNITMHCTAFLQHSALFCSSACEKVSM